MRVYLKQNVFEATLDRLRYLYDEFPEVMLSFSGGKDSTVLLNLALMVAAEKNRLPLKVFWLDQEAEWDAVVTYMRSVMNRPDVEPYWFQGEFKLFNATTTSEDPWLHCWREGDTWMRPKEPNSIHTNTTGTDRFGELFHAFGKTYFGHTKMCHLSGVRCEESPARLLGLTGYNIYKGITWCNKGGSAHNHYVFYPLYDWTWRDIWKAIHANGWRYCKLYDYMYQYGVPVTKMRVSNVHHETAVHVLHFLQEIEPETWNKLVERVSSVAAVARCEDAYKCPAELPSMFATWREYRDYLNEKLILDPKHRAIFTKRFKQDDKRFIIEEPEVELDLMRHHVGSLLLNDWEGVFATQYGITRAKNTRTGRERRQNGVALHWSTRPPEQQESPKP